MSKRAPAHFPASDNWPKNERRSLRTTSTFLKSSRRLARWWLLPSHRGVASLLSSCSLSHQHLLHLHLLNPRHQLLVNVAANVALERRKQRAAGHQASLAEASQLNLGGARWRVERPELPTFSSLSLDGSSLPPPSSPTSPPTSWPSPTAPTWSWPPFCHLNYKHHHCETCDSCVYLCLSWAPWVLLWGADRQSYPLWCLLLWICSEICKGQILLPG